MWESGISKCLKQERLPCLDSAGIEMKLSFSFLFVFFLVCAPLFPAFSQGVSGQSVALLDPNDSPVGKSVEYSFRL